MATTTPSVSDESVVELTDVFETIRVTADLRAKSEADQAESTDQLSSLPAWHALRRPVAYFLASRLVILIAGLVAKWRVPRLAPRERHHRMGRCLVHQNCAARLPPWSVQRGGRQPMGFLPGLSGHRAARRRRHRAQLCRRGDPALSRVRPDFCGGHLAGGAQRVRPLRRRSIDLALRLLPRLVRAEHGLHRGALPDRGRRLPVRTLAAQLDDRIGVRCTGQPDEEFRSRSDRLRRRGGNTGCP